jgi:hypothetical protein
MQFSVPLTAVGFYFNDVETGNTPITVRYVDNSTNDIMLPTTLTDSGNYAYVGLTSSLPMTEIVFRKDLIPADGWVIDQFTVQAVPEPQTVVFLLGGLGSLFLFRRRLQH